jgi:hypothetical protein
MPGLQGEREKGDDWEEDDLVHGRSGEGDILGPR